MKRHVPHRLGDLQLKILKVIWDKGEADVSTVIRSQWRLEPGLYYGGDNAPQDGGYVRARQKMGELRAALARLGDTDTNITSSARSETETALDAMFAAPSLEAGRQQLVKLGFEPLTK